MRSARWPFVGLSVLLLWIGATPILADTIDPHILLNQSSAIPGFNSTSRFTSIQTVVGSPTRYGVADVDYAVFAPGHFLPAGLPLPNVFPQPPLATQFVYAYQIFNLPDPDPRPITEPPLTTAPDLSLTFLSINGFNGGVVSSISQSASVDPQEPEIASVFFQIVFDALKQKPSYLFGMAGVEPGRRSTILYLTSPQGPAMIDAYADMGGGVSPSAFLPAPSPNSVVTDIDGGPVVPTPSALSAGAACLLAILLAHVLSRHRACRSSRENW